MNDDSGGGSTPPVVGRIEGVGSTERAEAHLQGKFDGFAHLGGLAAQQSLGSFRIRQAPTNLSFVEPHEDEQAQQVIDAQFREMTKSSEHPNGVTFREHAKLTRYFCAVKIYVRPEELKVITREDGSTQTLYLPDTIRAEDRFQACVGLVVALGPDAFTTKDGTPRGSSFKVGDWICFPRSDIIRMDFCGIAIGIMTDDRAVIVTDDPTLWTVGGMTFKA